MAGRRRFRSTVGAAPRGGAVIPVPFDPDEVWGPKTRHHVRGSVDGKDMRCVLQQVDGGYAISLGAAWVRDCGVAAGSKVSVAIEPEGPQRDDLAPDVRQALEDDPRAAAFFDGLAQFYRKAYLRWVDATKRSPDIRAARIAEMIRHLHAGHKERPGT